ncbi:MAG TPA: T9SS type A sorting domain-containing protein [Bacteroidia bacterium]|jgi:hypothetical protein|nr:T9SS type A sorting domain-containing protein [Bacteroidia bacterium]
MKNSLTLCLLLALTFNVKPQSFTIKLSPDTAVITQGQNTTFSLLVTPTGGFDLPISLSAQGALLNAVTIAPPTLNPPYNNCQVNVALANHMPGIYPVLIKGLQGSITSYDTAYVKILFNPSSQWYQFKQQNSGILSNDPIAVTVDKNNNVYATSGSINGNASYAGVSSFNHNTWQRWTQSNVSTTNFWGHQTHQQAEALCGVSMAGAVADSNNRVWIGSNNGLLRLKNNVIDSCLFTGDSVSKVATYNNKICVATNKGLKYYNGSSWTSYDITNSAIPSNHLTQLAMQNDSIIWIGTCDKGLVKFNLHTWYTYNMSNMSSFVSNTISALTVDKLHNVWVATIGSKLLKYNNVSWRNISTPCYEISTIHADYQNNIWLGFQSGNTYNCLAKYNGSSFTEYNSSNSGFACDATTPGYGRIHDITEDKNHVLWISTFGDGLFAFGQLGLTNTIPTGFTGINSYETAAASSLNVLVYPNPSVGNLTIVSPQKIDAITVINLLGETVSRTNPNDLAAQINIDKAGVYFVIVSADNKTSTQKIIISQ